MPSSAPPATDIYTLSLHDALPICFARVDALDSEQAGEFARPGLHGTPGSNAAPPVFAAPLLTRSWFHTGAYFEDRELTERCRGEFYAGDSRPLTAGNHQLQLGARPRDTHRALRGRLLRTEAYGLDGSALVQHPYSVTEHRYIVRERQAG